MAAIESLAREIESSPRLVVSVHPDLVEGLSGILAEAAQAIGFAGAIQVRGDGSRMPAAFHLDFGDGTAEFNPALAADRVAATLTALGVKAKAIHAEMQQRQRLKVLDGFKSGGIDGAATVNNSYSVVCRRPYEDFFLLLFSSSVIFLSHRDAQ